jgi:hypothetical protein
VSLISERSSDPPSSWLILLGLTHKCSSWTRCAGKTEGSCAFDAGTHTRLTSAYLQEHELRVEADSDKPVYVTLTAGTAEVFGE